MTSRIQYEASITTNPSDFGYGHGKVPSDAEIFRRIGVDVRGTISRVGAFFAKEEQQLQGTYYRVVIREARSKTPVSKSDFLQMYREILDLKENRKYLR